MADQKLSELDALPSAIGDTDLIYVVRDSTGYKATGADLPAGEGGGNVSAGGTLTANALVIGQGSQDVAVTTTGTGVLTALGVNVGSDGAFVTRGGNAGTPSAIVLTNASGTAASLTAGVASAVAVGGITGLGTNVATALAVNIGSAGAPVLFNGAGGTPSSLTLTNATGLPASSLTAGALTANVTLGEGAGQIVLDAALSADGTYSGIVVAGTAGATLAFGDLVYFAAADSRWELTDADADSTAGAVRIGICVLAAASDGDPTLILTFGKIRADTAFPDLTVGAPAYIGTTAGDIQTAQPSGTDDVIRIVGYGVTVNELFFCPSNDYMTHT